MFVLFIIPIIALVIYAILDNNMYTYHINATTKLERRK